MMELFILDVLYRLRKTMLMTIFEILMIVIIGHFLDRQEVELALEYTVEYAIEEWKFLIHRS